MAEYRREVAVCYLGFRKVASLLRMVVWVVIGSRIVAVASRLLLDPC